ncbi:MAG: 2-oxo acid dehydrogenase subunit E2 [Planctomycetes bacterium]|nr:2-oxo acid dehydrogenase subunit E2 [Planctomycetota bacterium]
MAGLKQPDDKSHFLLPDLGEGLVEAELISWRVKPGDVVTTSSILAEMQTDKALVEVPSPWPGTVSELCGKPGDIMKVGKPLVRYAVSGAAPAAAPDAKGPACVGASVAAGVPQAEGDQGTVVGTMSGALTVSDRFARKPEHTVAAPVRGKVLATPAVRRIAREMGIDINKVAGTGHSGRVTASDVHGFAGGSTTGFAPRTVAASIPMPPVDKDGVSQRIAFRGVRRKIAEGLERSVRTAVHFTVVDEADVTALDRRRREYSKVVGQKLSMMPFIMAAICRALRKHPSLNANVDDTNNEILIKGVINLSIAVDTDSGLMVPVVRNADQCTLVDLANQVKVLAGRCRDRTISREESMGGTFTLSNVGSYGGMFATPIINYPEVAILAVGRTKERVLVKDGRFYAGLVLPLSLSCDHRVVDGAEGARFLNTVVGLLEEPSSLL